MKILITIFFLAAHCLFLPLEADGRKTGYRTSSYQKLETDKRRKEKGSPLEELKEQAKSVGRITAADSAGFRYAAFLEVRGYDKKANSNRESLFIHNGGDRTINGCRIEIRYLSMSGELLHTREIDLNAEIKSGGSHKFDIPTWDPQHSYRYHSSPLPRQTRSSVPAIPYRIETEIIAFQF